MSSQVKKQTPAESFVSETEEPELSWIDIIRPAGLVPFLTMWAASRQSRLLFAGLPFLLMALGGTAFVVWLSRAPKDDLVERYQVKIEQQVDNEQYDEALLLLKTVSRLRPLDFRFQFQRSLLLIETGETDQGLAELVRICPPDERGYAPARNWLIQQAMSKKPLLPLTDDQLLQQMRRMSKEVPGNLDNQRMLAAFYSERGQMRLAEAHLFGVVREFPELSLELAKIQKVNGRESRVIEKSYAAAEEFFSQALSSNPDNDQARIGWARCMGFKDRWQEAEAILQEGLATNETPELKNALSEIYSLVSERQLKQSIANRPRASRAIVQALNLNPENGKALLLLSSLSASGEVIPTEALDPAIQFYRTRLDEAAEPSEQDLAILSSLLQATGQFREAARMVESLADEHKDLRIELAKLYRLSGETAKADKLYEDLIAGAKADFKKAETDSVAVETFARLLISAGQFDEAITTIENLSADSITAGSKRLLSVACLSRYDQVVDDSAIEPELKISLLRKALESGGNVGAAIQRLAQFAFSSRDGRAEAETLLNRIAASGQISELVYSVIGESAMIANQPDEAIRWLEKARALQPKNPVILNNLAFALVKAEEPDPKQALPLINQALELVPSQPEFHFTRAEVYAALNRWDDVILDLTVALDAGRNGAEVHELLAKAYTETGQKSLAAEHEKIASEYSNHTP